MATRRPDRRPNAAGDPRSPGAGVRQHRGRIADRRPLRGARRASALRCRGQLEGARRRADGGGRGPVGGHGGGPEPRRGRPSSPPSPAGLALTAGIAALVAGALRLGFLANFISEPVLKGFVMGLALTIIIGQLPKLFGISPRDRRLLRAGMGAPHQSGRREGAHVARRDAFAGGDHRAAPARSRRSRLARRRCGRDRAS